MSMEQRQYTISFLSPAFLGDAHQRGVWRTPPFKAELRRWWRMAMAARPDTTLQALRRTEGQLFGDAAGHQGRKSRVRLRLRGARAWHAGTLVEWSPKGGSKSLMVTSGKTAVPADLYLGYGPIENRPRVGPGLRNAPAIDAGESATLALAWPTGNAGADALDEALGLMSVLGCVGGRSRNGWGSYVLESSPTIDLSRYAHDWRTAIDASQWPQYIGRDEHGLLLWRSAPSAGWEPLIHKLGEIRKTLCTKAGPLRPLMSYPVTNKTQQGWTNTDRVPNSLRFKIVIDDDGQLRAQVVHLPHRPADELWNRLDSTVKQQFPALWQDAHERLDDELERVSR
ncbi:RAMP superfamily CRISPR-associated protein [Arhodomonas sp. AD133]|uniref:RAMP superfamily CRISPR-associated protein n=1 Tax=Arhodomonas sp. AD133 TaxID=3415009 RepID=UPI003EBC1C7C